MTAPAADRATVSRWLVLFSRAYNQMTKLTVDEQGVYWLAWRNLSQPCLTLDDVERALAPGSAWRAMKERAK